MTRDRTDPSENVSSSKIAVAIHQFGRKISTSVNELYDSGDEPIKLNIGHLNIMLNLFLLSHELKQQQTQKKTIKLTEGADCRTEFIIKLPYGSLKDVQELGELKIFHATNVSNNCQIFNLRKV